MHSLNSGHNDYGVMDYSVALYDSYKPLGAITQTEERDGVMRHASKFFENNSKFVNHHRYEK